MTKSLKKQFIWLSCLYAVAITAIIRANFNYIDDMGRVMNGTKGWGFYSRFTTDFLSTFVHGGSYLADISPLPQLLAVLIMALAGCVILRLLAEPDLSPFWGSVAMIPLGLSPYFLQCLSYKYDAPYMALSVLVSVLPPLVYSGTLKRQVLYFLAVLASVLVMCTTYQAASGVFPMLVLAIALKLWLSKYTIRSIVTFLLISAAGYLAGLLIFRLFIVVPVDFYASTDLFSLSGMIPGILANLSTYLNVILKDFRTIWLVLIAVICCLFVYAAVASSQRSRLVTIFISLIVLIVLFMLSFGAYLALSKPLYDPRGMYGFGVFLSLISVPVVCIRTPVMKYTRLSCVVLGYLFIVFAFNYGNALNEQKEYTDYRITQVISSLNTLDNLDGRSVKTVEISGSTGYAKSIENRPSDCRMLKNLVPVAFSEDRSWGYTLLLDYYGLSCLQQDPSKELTKMDLPVLCDTPLHTIRGDEDNILIILK